MLVQCLRNASSLAIEKEKLKKVLAKEQLSLISGDASLLYGLIIIFGLCLNFQYLQNVKLVWLLGADV